MLVARLDPRSRGKIKIELNSDPALFKRTHENRALGLHGLKNSKAHENLDTGSGVCMF